MLILNLLDPDLSRSTTSLFVNVLEWQQQRYYYNYTRLMASFRDNGGVGWYQNIKLFWILLQQEMMEVMYGDSTKLTPIIPPAARQQFFNGLIPFLLPTLECQKH